MIVEDEIIIATTLQIFIQSLGYDIFGVFTAGEEAIQAVKGKMKPDLVLMDINLLGTLNGMQTSQLIEKYCDANIVYVTGVSELEKEIKEMAKSKKFRGVLSKPVSKTTLAELIKKAL